MQTHLKVGAVDTIKARHTAAMAKEAAEAEVKVLLVIKKYNGAIMLKQPLEDNKEKEITSQGIWKIGPEEILIGFYMAMAAAVEQTTQIQEAVCPMKCAWQD